MVLEKWWEENNILTKSNLFNSFNSNVVNIPKKYAMFMVVLQLFYKRHLSDINMDIFEWTDLLLITWRRGEEYYKFLFVLVKDVYNTDEQKIISHYKENNVKIIEVKFNAIELISFLFSWLIEKYKEFLEKNNKDIINVTFYDFLLKTNLNDSWLYITEWVIIQNKEFKQIKVEKNNRVNLFMATRKIEDGIIKKVFSLVLRPNYTWLSFDDISKWMLTLYKVEEMIFEFISWWWINMIKRENPELFAQLEIDEEKKKNYWKKVLRDFISLLDLLSIRISDAQESLLKQSQGIWKEELEILFKKIDLFWGNLKWKDNISKFFTSLESGSSLVLVTWPTWSWKTTYLMTWLQELLRTKVRTVITLEDPIEFLLENKIWLVYQREIKKDVPDYIMWVKDALREKPDIIVLWEIREDKNVNIANQLIEAAKTWHLILWTLHATNLYDWYKRFKNLAGVEETFLNYMINLRRVKINNGEYVNVYSHYIYDKAKDTASSEKEMREVDKSLYWLTFKLIILFIIGEINIDILVSNASESTFLVDIIDKIKNTTYIQDMFSNENKIKIDVLWWNSE